MRVLVNENGFQLLLYILTYIYLQINRAECHLVQEFMETLKNRTRQLLVPRLRIGHLFERVYHLSSEKNEVITIINVFHIPGCRASLGMEDGSIKDSQITAQSSANTAHNGRLYSSSSWCSSNSNAGYLQVTWRSLLQLCCIILILVLLNKTGRNKYQVRFERQNYFLFLLVLRAPHIRSIYIYIYEQAHR